jgi:hypothetical protein
VFPVRYELNPYILFVFRTVLTKTMTVSLNSINRLGFVAET